MSLFLAILAVCTLGAIAFAVYAFVAEGRAFEAMDETDELFSG